MIPFDLLTHTHKTKVINVDTRICPTTTLKDVPMCPQRGLGTPGGPAEMISLTEECLHVAFSITSKWHYEAKQVDTGKQKHRLKIHISSMIVLQCRLNSVGVYRYSDKSLKIQV